jgi:chromosome segregation ATPase
MNKHDFLLGHGSAWRGKSPASTEQPKRVVGLDDEIFAPAGTHQGGGQGPLPLEPITGRPWSPLEETWSGDLNLQCFFQDAGLAGKAAPDRQPRLPEELNNLSGGERQRFRELLAAALNRVGVLENIVTEQSAELSLCRSQIADLCGRNKEQAVDLQAAQDESMRLTETIVALERTVAERETEVADANRKLALAEGERQESQVKLSGAMKRTTELSQRLLEANILANDKDTATASIHEQIDNLQEALARAQAEKRELAGEIEEINHTHRGALADQRERFEELLGQIKVALAKRDHDIKRLEKARAALAKRCDGLAKSIEVLKCSELQLLAKIDSRGSLVGILESQLRSEREIAERRAGELTAELQRVRAEHAASERALEEICRDITFLLPEFSTQFGRINKPGLVVAASRMKAA